MSHSTVSLVVQMTPPLCCVQQRLGIPLAPLPIFLLMRPVPVFRVCDPVSHFPGCPCCLGPQPCHHSFVPARCLPPWAAGAPTPAYHSCLRASAWPHCIPGAACPPLLLPLALTGPWALPPPGTGWHPPFSGPPSQGRINRILSQPPVPVWAHLWVSSDGQASVKVRAF